jgi:hypothetical protein
MTSDAEPAEQRGDGSPALQGLDLPAERGQSGDVEEREDEESDADHSGHDRVGPGRQRFEGDDLGVEQGEDREVGRDCDEGQPAEDEGDGGEPFEPGVWVHRRGAFFGSGCRLRILGGVRSVVPGTRR